MNRIRKSSRNHFSEDLFILVGFFSTMQIITLFGVTLFNILMLVTLLYLCASRKININNVDLTILLLICSALLSTGFTFLFSIVGPSYKNQAFTSFVNTMIIYCVYILIKGNGELILLKAFFKGFYYSCIVQIVWCLLQLTCWKISNIDINHLIFNQLLNMVEIASSYRNGNVVCTGLCWHAANLVPVLLFYFLKTKHLFMKLLCILLAFLSKSATLSIAIVICSFLDFCVNLKKIAKKDYKEKDIIMVIIFFIVVFVGLFIFGTQVLDAVKSVIQRIKDITSNEAGNSSATHFSYYIRMFEIVKSNSVIENLFGYGLGCAGSVFSTKYGQYTDLIWVVESDFINIFLNQGLFGFIVVYGFLLKIIIKSLKVSNKSVIFMSIMLLCGVMYNVQFNWTILLELMIYRGILNKTEIFVHYPSKSMQMINLEKQYA